LYSSFRGRGRGAYRGSGSYRGLYGGGCDGCAFCTAGACDASAGREARQSCGEFKRIKALTAPSSYLEVELKPPELVGFAAAGMLLVRRDGRGDMEVLFAREYRAHGRDGGAGDKLNFLGGKRELKSATARDVAVRKLDAESGHLLHRPTLAGMHGAAGCPVVLWSAKSKYALFEYELTDKADIDIDVRCVGYPGAKRLEWVPRSALLDHAFVSAELHGFAAHMLADLIKSNVLDKLEQLLDCVARVRQPALPTAQPASSTTEAAFNVLEVLRKNATTARPDARPLPHAPSAADIYAAVAQLHKADKCKMLLRFHPDRLQSVLSRSPTAAETEMANAALTAVNLMFESNNEQNLLAALKQLDQLRSPSAPAMDVGDFAKLLASIKVSARA
jgi:8-oxo-dGTP pyrophosphatase MutT (NUDIX family)